jgi:CHASE2 domain-containing sensor protein
MSLVEASASVFGIAILLALCGERIVASVALLVAVALLVIGVVTAGIVAAATPGDPIGVVWALISLGVIGVAGRRLYKRRSPEAERQFEAGIRRLFSRTE